MSFRLDYGITRLSDAKYVKLIKLKNEHVNHYEVKLFGYKGDALIVEKTRFFFIFYKVYLIHIDSELYLSDDTVFYSRKKLLSLHLTKKGWEVALVKYLFLSGG